MSDKGLPLISIIVPVYNTDMYLEQCLESIVNQNYPNIEIIIIDDGSTDNCPMICDKYAESYEYVKVIHQENAGLVCARKKGVSIAKGDYIGFVDSDDWIDVDMYERMLETDFSDKVDIITCGFKRPTESGYIYITNGWEDGLYEGENLEKIYTTMMFDEVNGTTRIVQSLWTKLIRKSLLIKCMRDLDEKITLGEDVAVVYNCFLQAKCVMIKNITPYIYRINNNSMCYRENIEIFERIYRFYFYMHSICRDYDERYQLLKQLNNYVIRFFQWALKNNFNLQQRPAIKLPKFYTARVILYGAGLRGQAYYKEIIQDTNIELVSWVDKKLAGQTVNGYLIDSVESLLSKQYDKILISVKNKDVVDEIKKELVELGVEESKIVWEEMKYKKDVYWLEWEN